MTTPAQDPTFQTGCFTYGYTIPGLGYYGNARTYPQQAIYGARAYGGEIPGKNQEADMLAFVYGARISRKKGPWPITPYMDTRTTGAWAKRVIFYTWRGQQMARRYTQYDGSPKNHFVPTMLKLIEANVTWHTVGPEIKRRLDSDASRLGLRYSGYNYYIKLFIQDSPRLQLYV